MMKIAVEGCAHGELDNIYETIKFLENRDNFKIDLLICCGDFQASRNENDLRCMAVPLKYSKICSFYKYYNGEKIAPVLTLFIGGNHEASNYLQELPYGGWVAPNIYYLGNAGVVNIAGIRIGGISGIYKAKDYMKGHYEHPPYSDNSLRTVYHIRNLEVFRLKQLYEKLDIFLSHDWPSGIWNYGNKNQLLRVKPFFEKDIESGELGSKPCEELLEILKPEYWFSAHLHCKFAAVVLHSSRKITKFLALDKCLPQRRFLQVFDVPKDTSKIELSYDLEWLTILRLTNHLLSVKNVTNYMPGTGSSERWRYTPTEEEKQKTLEIFGDNLLIPLNFEKTANGYDCNNKSKDVITQPEAVNNPQTILFCKKLLIDDAIELLLNLSITGDNSINSLNDSNLNETFIDDTDLSLNRSLLNLPEPVNVNENLDEQILENNYLKKNQIEVFKDEATPEMEQKHTNKVFKRRNASIYQTDE